jgi:hypothetical protein
MDKVKQQRGWIKSNAGFASVWKEMLCQPILALVVHGRTRERTQLPQWLITVDAPHALCRTRVPRLGGQGGAGCTPSFWWEVRPDRLLGPQTFRLRERLGSFQKTVPAVFAKSP